jgi:putative hydrolase of the HAD superfamily
MIFFDAAGTLIHLPQGVGFHYREVAGRHGFLPDEGRLTTAFRTAFLTLPPPLSTRLPRPDDDRGWWRTLVHRVVEEAGAPAHFDRESYFADLYEEFTKPGVWSLYPEAREVLHQLAARYRLGIISNFDGRLRPILEHLGIDQFFEVVAISSEVGADKPDPWIFERALALAGTTAEQALHVGDDPECDWDGAERAGLGVFRLDRPANDLRGLLKILGD